MSRALLLLLLLRAVAAADVGDSAHKGVSFASTDVAPRHHLQASEHRFVVTGRAGSSILRAAVEAAGGVVSPTSSDAVLLVDMSDDAASGVAALEGVAAVEDGGTVFRLPEYAGVVVGASSPPAAVPWSLDRCGPPLLETLVHSCTMLLCADVCCSCRAAQLVARGWRPCRVPDKVA
jgi:hypothetical protein